MNIKIITKSKYLLHIIAILIIFSTTNIDANIFPLKGMHYVSWWRGEYSSANSDASLDNLKNDNANALAVLVTWYQSTLTSTTIYSDSNKTPSDGDVREAIQDAHSRGMAVILKPHIDVDTDEWRGNINPSDKSTWFGNYKSFIKKYAQIAQQENVEIFCIGTELKNLSTDAANSSYWNDVINSVKSNYTIGPLVYAANWDEYDTVIFWDQINVIGIDAYFPLSDDQTPSMALLKGSTEGWFGNYLGNNWVQQIRNFHINKNMPVLFTEIGCSASDYAAKEPWNITSANYNGTVQSNYYRAALEVWQTTNWFWGCIWWAWKTDPNAGGSGDTDFTPQNKPAEGAIQSIYSDNSLLQPIPALYSPGNWDTTGTNVVLSWEDVSSEWIWKYQIQIANYNDTTYTSPVINQLTKNTSITNTFSNGNYRWRVRVFKGRWANWSEERFFTVSSGVSNLLFYDFEDGGVHNWTYDNTTGSGTISSTPTNNIDEAFEGTRSIYYSLSFQNGTTFNRFVGVQTNVNLSSYNYLILRVYLPDPPDQSTLDDLYDDITLKAYIKAGVGWTTYESANIDVAKVRLGRWVTVYIDLSGASDLNDVKEMGVHIYATPTVNWTTKLYIDYVLASSSIQKPGPIYSYDTAHIEGWKNDTTPSYQANLGLPSASDTYAYNNNYSLSSPLSITAGQELNDVIYADCEHSQQGWNLTNYAGIEAYVYVPTGTLNQIQAQVSLKHSDAWSWAEGSYSFLTPGKWKKIYCDFDNMTDGVNPVTITKSNIKEIGIRIYRNSTDTLTESTTLYIDGVSPILLLPPNLVLPDDNSTVTTTTPEFRWNSVLNADSYHIQVSEYPDFSILKINQTGIIATNWAPGSGLSDGQSYYWRVRGYNNSKGWGGWSEANYFTVNIAGLGGAVLFNFEDGSTEAWDWDNSWGDGNVVGPTNKTTKAYNGSHSIKYDITLTRNPAGDDFNRALRVTGNWNLSSYRGIVARVYIPVPPDLSKWDEVEENLQFTFFIKTGPAWTWYESADKHLTKVSYGGWVYVYIDFQDVKGGGAAANLNDVKEMGVKVYCEGLSAGFGSWTTNLYIDYVVAVEDPFVQPAPSCTFGDNEINGWKPDTSGSYQDNFGIPQISDTNYSAPSALAVPLSIAAGSEANDVIYKYCPWRYVAAGGTGWDLSSYQGVETYVYMPGSAQNSLQVEFVTKYGNWNFAESGYTTVTPGKWTKLSALWSDFAGLDSTQILQLGLRIYKNSTETVSDTTTFYFDDFIIAKIMAPEIYRPAQNGVVNTNKPTFIWNSPTGATSYDLQVATDNNFNNKVINLMGYSSTNYTSTINLNNGNYYCRVRATDGTNYSQWSEIVEFVVDTSAPANLQVLYDFEDGSTEGWTTNSGWGTGNVTDPNNTTIASFHSNSAIRYSVSFPNGGTPAINRGFEVVDNGGTDYSGWAGVGMWVYIPRPPDQNTFDNMQDKITLSVYVKTGPTWDWYESAVSNKTKLNFDAWNFVYLDFSAGSLNGTGAPQQVSNLDEVHTLGLHFYAENTVAWNTYIYIDYVYLMDTVNVPAPQFTYDKGIIEGFKNDTSSFYSNNLGLPETNSAIIKAGTYSMRLPLSIQNGDTVNDIVYIDSPYRDTVKGATGWDFSNYDGLEAWVYVPSGVSTSLQSFLGVKYGSAWTFARGAYVNITPGTWNRVYINFTNADYDEGSQLANNKDFILDIQVGVYAASGAANENTYLYIDEFIPYVSGGLGIPTLISPSNNVWTNNTTPVFDWTDVTGADEYHIQFADNSNFVSPYRTATNTLSEYTPGTPLNQGTNYWRVRAYSTGSGAGEWSSSRIIKIDTIPPSTVTLSTPADGNWTSDTTPTFNWNAASDTLSGIKNYRIEIDTETNFNPPLVLTNITPSLTYTPSVDLTNGIYYWRVRAYDNVGNQGNFSEIRSIGIDTNGPSKPNLLAPEDNIWTNSNSITLIWQSAIDTDSGVSNYEIQISTNDTFTGIIEETNVTQTNYIASTLPDDTYYWHIRAYDKLGQPGDWSLCRVFNIDTISPTVSSPVPNNGDTISSLNVNFSWSGQDEASGINFYEVKIDTDGNTNTWEISINTNANNYSYPFSTDGIKYWKVRAIDNAGNTGDWCGTTNVWIFTIDTNEVIPTLYQPVSEFVNTNRPEFFWSDESVQGATKYWLQVSDTNDFSSTVVNNSNIANTNYTSASSLGPDGTYYWQVKAYTGAGWHIWSSVVNFIIDTVPPAIPSLDKPSDNTYTNNNTPTFVWNSATGADEYILWLDDTINFNSPRIIEWTNTGTSFTPGAGLSDSEYFWKVKAKDSAGNESDWSKTNRIVIDTQNPQSFALISPEDNRITADTTPQFVWNNSIDNGPAGISNYRLQIATDNAFGNIIRDIVVVSTNYTLLTAEQLGTGTNYWRVIVYDKAGNFTVSAETNVLIIDTSLPVITLIYPITNEYISDTTPTFVWQSNADASRYHIQISTDTNFSSIVAQDTNLSMTNYTVSTMLSDGKYFWQVRGHKESTGIWGDWTVESFYIDTQPPQFILSVESINTVIGKEVTIKWSSASDTGSEFDRFEIILPTSQQINLGNATEYKITFETQGIYQIKIRAYDKLGNYTEKVVTINVATALNRYETKAYPNPCSRERSLNIEYGYDLDKQISEVGVEVYDIIGNIVYKKSSVPLENGKIEWNLKNQDNRRIVPGLYVFRIIIQYTDGTKDETEFKKIAISE